MLKKAQESIGLRGACWNGRGRTILVKRAGVCMGSQECERVVRGAQEFVMVNPPAPVRGPQAVGLGLQLPAQVAVSRFQCDCYAFCFLL